MELLAEPFVNLLQAAHGIFGFVLFVALLMACIFTFAVSAANWKHIAVSSSVAAIAYLLTFLMGWLIYPVFRVDVRAAFLDKLNPWATGLFEIKEHLAAVGAFVALGVLSLALFGRLLTASCQRRQLFGGLLAAFGLLTATVLLLGFIFRRAY